LRESKNEAGAIFAENVSGGWGSGQGTRPGSRTPRMFAAGQN
jgi:hypothetical protein